MILKKQKNRKKNSENFQLSYPTTYWWHKYTNKFHLTNIFKAPMPLRFLTDQLLLF